FTNQGVVNLYDSASLIPSGSVENLQEARISVFGDNVTSSIAHNHGKIEVVAGATLHAPSFALNEGVLLVDGLLDIGASSSGSSTSMFAAAVSSGFTNAA